MDQAARRLYQLRLVLHASEQAPTPAATAAAEVRQAERRAHAALTRAGFADPAIAAEVLRQVQVLTLTRRWPGSTTPPPTPPARPSAT